MGRPVPTTRAVWVAALGLVPAGLAVLSSPLWALALALDLALLILIAADFALAPSRAELTVTRSVEPVLSSGVSNRVRLTLERRRRTARPVHGELRDTVQPGPLVFGHRQRFTFEDHLTVEWRLTPTARGDLAFGDVWVRLEGPLGLCARQLRFAAQQRVKVFPDLTSLSRDALALQRASAEAGRRVPRLNGEGREFEALREYRQGDDRRAIDWKATARRGRTMVRQHQPERNQHVVLLLDCGRHMVGEVAGRRKLDHAVDAALQLARLSLDQGDLVGVMAFSETVRSWLPPRRGREQLRAITQSLFRVEAVLEEANYAAAFEMAFSRGSRRSLVVVLTDLFDADAAASLADRTLRLTPRHLPLIASIADTDVAQLAGLIPGSRGEAFQRVVAGQLEADASRIAARLRDGGARVVRSPVNEFGAASMNAYLDIKRRGLL